jgi:hypothetical protein
MVADFHGIPRDGRSRVVAKVNAMERVMRHPILNVSLVLVLKSGYLMKTFKQKIRV